MTLSIQKKLVVDERGRPLEVIISWAQYQQIIEMLGLDLDEATIADLRKARRDRQAGVNHYEDQRLLPRDTQSRR
jgi:PHD/YefM family antitoxin component YafN of YafNO toxin-antitoxin module